METDLRATIIPKSDQLNADDLIGTTITVKITRVSLCAGDQPIAINYEGDKGKPYLPCKSMRRVLVNVWGPDGNAFVGRSLTLYRDEKVTWGGVAVGGIRISHMSHIKEPVTMALTVTKASRKPFTVKPLAISETRKPPETVAEEKPATITKAQADEIKVALADCNLTPKALADYFGITGMSEIRVDQIPAIKKWIDDQSATETKGDLFA